MPPLPSMAELVAALPELYQPIFGHPEFDTKAGRNVADRLVPIMQMHDALARKLGRPVRVLDLGCAQGWFSFNLAKAGAQTVGLDLIGPNINVCNMLVLENRELAARFKLFEVEKAPDVIPEGQFDLVLGLSVLHHICFHNNKEFVRVFLQKLFARIPSAIVEFALRSEGTKLTAPLPDSPDYFIDFLPYRRVVATHPSPTGARPLYFCSTEFSYLDGEMQELA